MHLLGHSICQVTDSMWLQVVGILLGFAVFFATLTVIGIRAFRSR